MATTGADQPSQTQLLFARAVILTMELWPAMRLAVSEEWGGADSAAKRDYLISHICDTYSAEAATGVGANGGGGGSTATAGTSAPATPDMDDLAETLTWYFEDEYESKLEDGSADWIAGRLAHFHKIIYAVFPPTTQSLQAAHAEVNKLYEATVQLRGQKAPVPQRQRRTAPQAENGVAAIAAEDDDDSSSESDHESANQTAININADAMDVDRPSTGAPTSRQRQEPTVDEDGFITVVKGRRR